MLINFDPRFTSYPSAPSSRSTKTFFDTTSYRSAPSQSPCASSEAASSTYSTASTSCGASTSGTSASPCPPCPYPDDLEIETDLLVAVCATQTDSTISQSMSKDEIYMHWEDNAAYLEVGQGHLRTISDIAKRRRELDDKDAKDIRREARRKKKRKQQQKDDKTDVPFYDFMASVNATTRVEAPIDDWVCDDLEEWSTTIGTVGPKFGNGAGDIWKDVEPVKEEISIPVEILIPLPSTITQDEQKCKIRHVPGKGLGVIATANIAQGVAIVTESPFLMVDHPPNIHQVRSRLAKLPVNLQTLFSTFNPSLSPHHTNKVVDVIATNVIPLGDEPLVDMDDEILPLDADGEVEQRCRSGMFQTICRVNHSCTPNSRWTWFESGHMTLRALRPIANGEEITACYLQDTAMSHDDRRAALYETWQFMCTCPLCTLSIDRRYIEDERRGRFRHLRDEYIGLVNEDTWRREGLIACSAKIKKAIKLLEEGGQDGEIADCRWSLFILSVRWGDEGKARKEGSAWLRQVLKMGDDPGDQFRGWVKRPRTAIDWGMWDDDRSGDESECGTDDDFERTYHALTRVRLQSANVSSMRTGSRSSRRAAMMSGTKG